MNGRPTAAAAGKIDVGGDRTVNRLGFGAMRITGPGIWGDPPDRDRAKEVPRRAVAESIGALAELKDEGKIRHIGVSNVTEDQFREAERVAAIVSVQNRYNVVDRSSEPMLDLCDQKILVFLPWVPTEETSAIPAVVAAARRHKMTERQVALASLLARSPQVLPIPGSSNPEHVEENVPSASIELTAKEIRAITLALRPPASELSP